MCYNIKAYKNIILHLIKNAIELKAFQSSTGILISRKMAIEKHSNLRDDFPSILEVYLLIVLNSFSSVIPRYKTKSYYSMVGPHAGNQAVVISAHVTIMKLK